MLYHVLCELSRQGSLEGKTSTQYPDICRAMVECQFGKPRRKPRRFRPPAFWRDIVIGLGLMVLVILGCVPYIFGG